MSANALRLEARAVGGRTVLARIRGDGLLRASRPFRDGAASRVVVAHLGPGLIRGDRFATTGRVEAGAHLVVAGQMATRVLSGPEPARQDAAWHVGAGATLELLPEPILVSAGTAYVGATTLTLEAGASAIVTELLWRDAGAAVRTTTHLRRNERLAFVDALALDAGDGDAIAIGTLLVTESPDLAALDACADELPGVRAGVGILAGGGVLVRVTGTGVREVALALRALRSVLQPGRFGLPTGLPFPGIPSERH